MSPSTTTDPPPVTPSDEWDRRHHDPDPIRDLGYELVEWDTHWVSHRDGERVVFVPTEEDDFGREAYIVAASGAICDAFDNR